MPETIGPSRVTRALTMGNSAGSRPVPGRRRQAPRIAMRTQSSRAERGGAPRKPRENRAVANTPPTAAQHSPGPQQVRSGTGGSFSRGGEVAADQVEKELPILRELCLAYAVDLRHLVWRRGLAARHIDQALVWKDHVSGHAALAGKLGAARLERIEQGGISVRWLARWRRDCSLRAHARGGIEDVAAQREAVHALEHAAARVRDGPASV